MQFSSLMAATPLKRGKKKINFFVMERKEMCSRGFKSRGSCLKCPLSSVPAPPDGMFYLSEVKYIGKNGKNKIKF